MPGKRISYQWRRRENVSTFNSDWFWVIWEGFTVSSRRFQIAKLGSQNLLNWYLNTVFQQEQVVLTQYVCVQYIRMWSWRHWSRRCRYLSYQRTTTVWQRYSRTSIIRISIIWTLGYPNTIPNFKIPKHDLIFCNKWKAMWFSDCLGLIFHSTMSRKAYQHVWFYHLPKQLFYCYVQKHWLYIAS